MIINTQAIAFDQIKYSDNTAIAHVFTKKHGFQALMVSSRRPKKGIAKSIYFQPLFLLELEYYQHPKQSIQRLKNVAFELPYTNIPFEVHKRNISMFLAGLLSQVLRAGSDSEPIFEFLKSSFLFFDHNQKGNVNFHLLFLIKLSHFLGFGPEENYKLLPFFDLKEGRFMAKKTDHSNICPPETKLFEHLLNTPISQLETLQLSNGERAYLLEKILEFYSLHQPAKIKSEQLSVLKELYLTL